MEGELEGIVSPSVQFGQVERKSESPRLLTSLLIRFLIVFET